mgnify:CR=1 FL=1|tara:strand:+ start:2082 stop:2573 length:492 start_codon:yes stop_codon:yes gene_type:complete
MKSHDLAKNLEKWAEILKSSPDVEISDVLSALLSLTSQKTKLSEGTQEKSKEVAELPTDIEKKLAAMPPREIERYLTQEDKIFPAKKLLALAEMLGISSSKRQSRSALANLITKYYESEQMDMLMRTSKRRNQEGTEAQTPIGESVREFQLENNYKLTGDKND